ncbi:hypothetical protein T484DRAFT_1989967 [Baffinella frigidus]|nr:hypothetical protein T484DRAFT_1989967 [Cryptophyta sp. CCMP2293]
MVAMLRSAPTAQVLIQFLVLCRALKRMQKKLKEEDMRVLRGDVQLDENDLGNPSTLNPLMTKTTEVNPLMTKTTEVNPAP